MLIIKLGPLNWPIIGHLCALFRLQLNHEFTRAQVKLTRAQARVGPGVDTPLVKWMHLKCKQPVITTLA